MSEHSFCSVPAAHYIYAGPRTREEFDLIALPEMVHEWKHDRITTLLKNDGQQWERRCHSKCVGEHGAGKVTVIIQWFEERPVVLPPIDDQIA